MGSVDGLYFAAENEVTDSGENEAETQNTAVLESFELSPSPSLVLVLVLVGFALASTEAE